jgi:hypothetical protein
MEKKKKKKLLYENHSIQKNSIKTTRLELQTFRNPNCFLQSLNASSQNIELGEEEK